MTRLNRFLLLPCIAPLLLVLVVACLNLNKPVSLRVLTWRSSTLPLGVWFALGGTAGAGITFAAGLSLSMQTLPLRRQVHRQFDDPHVDPDYPFEEYQQQQTHSQSRTSDHVAGQYQQGPERDIRDPFPTISVPFRVIKTGTSSSSTTVRAQPLHDQNNAGVSKTDNARSVVAENESDHANVDGDWGSSLNDDW